MEPGAVPFCTHSASVHMHFCTGVGITLTSVHMLQLKTLSVACPSLHSLHRCTLQLGFGDLVCLWLISEIWCFCATPMGLWLSFRDGSVVLQKRFFV